MDSVEELAVVEEKDLGEELGIDLVNVVQPSSEPEIAEAASTNCHQTPHIGALADKSIKDKILIQ